MKNIKVLVTGGAGFIGSNICDRLIELGYNVVCFDNFSTGKIQNIEHLIINPFFKLIKADIRDLDQCREAMNGIDYVLHHAALGSVPRSINDPLTTNNVNIDGFLNVLTASRDAKIKRFIYAASSSTYGDSSSLPKIEDKIGKPLSPYAVTKYINELYADVFSRVYGIETIGLRYFNVFGKRQDQNSEYAAVIPLFITKLLNYESPVIYGNGNNSRDFTYIENVVQMNLLAISATNKDAINTVYNVAYGEQTSLNRLIHTIKEVLSEYDKNVKNIKLIYKEPRKGDIEHSLASIDKARKLLGYNPTHSLKDGILETVKWYFQNNQKK